MAKCKEKCEVYSRVTGYFRPVSNWNKGKKEEFRERRTYRVPGAVALLAACLLLSGCGHNVVTYSDGIGFETTFRPDSGNFGFVLRYGKVLSATVRENTTVEMVGEGKGKGDASGAASGTASASGSVTITVGRQITGRYVEALAAGATPEQLDEYTSPPPADPK